MDEHGAHGRAQRTRTDTDQHGQTAPCPEARPFPPSVSVRVCPCETNALNTTQSLFITLLLSNPIHPFCEAAVFFESPSLSRQLTLQEVAAQIQQRKRTVSGYG